MCKNWLNFQCRHSKFSPSAFSLSTLGLSHFSLLTFSSKFSLLKFSSGIREFPYSWTEAVEFPYFCPEMVKSPYSGTEKAEFATLIQRWQSSFTSVQRWISLLWCRGRSFLTLVQRWQSCLNLMQRWRRSLTLVQKQQNPLTVVQRQQRSNTLAQLQQSSLLWCRGSRVLLLKGTVSRDFLCPVFFIKQLLLVPIGKPRNDFKFFRIFVDLFVFVIDSPVMNTPGSRL
jgi:hypothetical protein